MPIFALRKIEAIKGKQEFDKLIVDDKCPFDSALLMSSKRTWRLSTSLSWQESIIICRMWQI